MKWKCDNDSRKQNELLEKQKIKERFQHDQPERSKREDYCEKCGHTSKECFSLMCTCHWNNRCGALNIVETQ